MAQTAAGGVEVPSLAQLMSNPLMPEAITAEAFTSFGTFIEPRPDGAADPAADQALASASGEEWLLAVAPPSEAAEPDPAMIRVFRIPRGVGVLLARGTWHACPYFEPAAMNFFNLELDDTNLVDHETCDLASRFGLAFTLQTGA